MIKYSIKTKIFVILILSVLVVQGLFTFYDIVSESRRERVLLEQNIEQLKGDISIIARQLIYNYDVKSTLSMIEAKLVGNPFLHSIAILDAALEATSSSRLFFAGGERLADGNVVFFKGIEEYYGKTGHGAHDIETDHYGMQNFSFTIEKNSNILGKVIISYSDDLVTQRVHALLKKSIIEMIIFLLVIVAVLYLAMDLLIVRSINTIANSFTKVSDDIREARVPEEGRSDEIGVLERGLNEMIDNVYYQSQEISRLRAYLFDIIDSMPSVLVATDTSGIVTQWNKAAVNAKGVSTVDAIGRDLWQLMPELKRFKSSYLKALQQQESQHLIRETIEYDKTRFFRITIFPLKANGAQGVVWRLDDVTELEKKDEQLRQIQKMETIGTLSAGLAHDFNNVLTGVKGAVSLMDFMLQTRSEIPLDLAKMEKTLKLANHSTDRAAEMVQQLLSISKKQELTLSKVNLNQLLLNTLKICQNTFDKKIELHPRCDAEESLVMGDGAQIEQVLLNMCVNASHAMTIMRKDDRFYGGKLTISIRSFDADNAFLSVHPDANEQKYWLMQISDTGVGMSADTVFKIFDPFFTTKEKNQGTGLGLAMVYNIIQQHGGFIDVYSDEGIGTTFNIYLPVYDGDDDTASLLTDEDEQLVKGTGCILVVDDEEIVREVVKNYLELCGYDVIMAKDGLDGVEVFKERQQEISAVLLDMAMPRLSGQEAYVQMQRIDPSIKVVLASGFKQDKRVQDMLGKGIVAFIQKPFSLIELSRKIKDAVS